MCRELIASGELLGSGQSAMAAPNYRPEAEPWLSLLSLVEALAVVGGLRQGHVKLQKAAPLMRGVETGFAVDQGSALVGL